MAAVGDIDWAAAQKAVADTGRRAAGLVRSIHRPDAPALGEWSSMELATHLSQVMIGINAMANGGGNLIEDLWDLSTMTKMMVGGDGSLTLDEVAQRIEDGADAIVATMAGASGDEVRSWMVKGTEASMPMLTCHALNELLVHGYDLARIQGLQWRISRGPAALVVEGFLFPSVAKLGRSMVEQESAKDVKATLEIRVRGGGRTYFNFDGGDLSVTAEPAGRVDCHLSVDPVAFLLVAWGRISQWNAIPKGQLLGWGRKPWLALKLRSMMRNP